MGNLETKMNNEIIRVFGCSYNINEYIQILYIRNKCRNRYTKRTLEISSNDCVADVNIHRFYERSRSETAI